MSIESSALGCVVLSFQDKLVLHGSAESNRHNATNETLRSVRIEY